MGKIAELRQVPTDKLVPYNANAKIHGRKQIEQLKKSINEFGFLSPCLIDADFNIIAGHGRVEAAKALGLDAVPCIQVDDLTDEQRRAYILADNRLTELGEWDRDILSAELQALKDEGFDIDLTGFTIDDIMIEEIDFSEIDEAWEDAGDASDQEPKAKPGDIFALGRHRLMCGDATDPKDVEKLTGGRSVQLVVTDPPYNVDYTGKTKDALKIDNDNQTDEAFFRFLVKAFKNLYEALEPGRSFYIWFAIMETRAFMNAAEKTGLIPRQMLLWVKNIFVLSRQDYNWRHEPCLYGWKDGAAHYFCEDKSQSTIFDKKLDVDKMPDQEAKDLLKKSVEYSTVLYEDRPMASEQHPTMKPINLIKKQIENSSRPGEIVLDLFGGSGTTLIAAEQTERTCYMMELSPEYVTAILDRFQAVTGQKPKKIKA